MTNRITRLTASAATSLTGHVVFGDHGVGAIPLDGEITLAAEGVDPWHGTLSTGAMEAAERLWTTRQHADRLTDAEAIAITRAAFDVDLAFLGLAADWPSSHVAPIGLGAVVEVAATVAPAQPHEAISARRATVRFELVDGSTDAAAFTLTGRDETGVLDHEDLHLHTRSGPGLDASRRSPYASSTTASPADTCHPARTGTSTTAKRPHGKPSRAPAASPESGRRTKRHSGRRPAVDSAA